MNSQTRAFLAALGIVAATGLVYLANKPSVPENCKEVVAGCDFNLGSGKYQRQEIKAQACTTDAGDLEVIPDKGSPVPTDIYSCTLSEYKFGIYPKEVPFACAWAPDGGDCFILDDLEDGGTTKRQAGDFTMSPGRFTGAQCSPRPCVEVAGSPWKP